MHSDGALLLLHNIQEPLHDFKGGSSPISEKQLMVMYAIVGEARRLVGFVIESNDGGDSKLLEDGDIVLGSV